MLEDLYKKVVLDHYRRPRCHEPLPDPDGTFRANNPACGDDVALQVRWRARRLDGVAFYGRGCTLCLASGSILAEWVRGRERADVEACLATFEKLMDGSEPDSGLPESVTALRGVLAYPARVRCVRLGWEALAAALAQPSSPNE